MSITVTPATATLEVVGLPARDGSVPPLILDLAAPDPEFTGMQAAWSDLELVGIPPTIVVDAGEGTHYVDWNTGSSLTFDPDGNHYADWNTGPDLEHDQKGPHYVDWNTGVDHQPQPLAGEYVYLGDVEDTQPTPALFWLQPNFGRIGAEFVATGIGLGAEQTTYDGVILLAGIVSGLIDWELLPPDHAEDEQFISFEARTTNMEHIRVTVQVPDTAPGGGQPVRARTDEQP